MSDATESKNPQINAVRSLAGEFVAKLMEHADSVQVFVTVHDGGIDITTGYELGAGNLYSRLGHVQEWLTMQSRFASREADRRDAPPEPPIGGFMQEAGDPTDPSI